MRILAGVGALALTLGIAAALPASAQEGYYVDDNGVYVKRGYIEDEGLYRRSALMTRRDVMRQVEAQGYYDISDLRPNGFGGNWQATAYIDGDLVTIVIDPYSGRVLSADEI